MTSTLLCRLAALTSLAVAAAAAPRARGEQQASSISTSSSKAFHLVLNVTAPGTDFTNTSVVDKLYLGTEHIGAGRGALVPSTLGAAGAINLTYTVNNTIQDGLEPDYWEAFYMGDTPDAGSAYVYGLELIVGSDAQFGLTTTTATTTTTSTSGDEDESNDGCLAVTAPVTGTFAVCDQGVDAPEAPRYPLFFVQSNSSGWYAAENLPDNCIAVKLLPECSSKEEYDDSDDVQAVACYEDVASIDWSQEALCT